MITNINDLRSAVSAGGTVYVSDSDLDKITIDEPIVVSKSTRIVGGNFQVNSGIGFLIKSPNVTIDSSRFNGRGQTTHTIQVLDSSMQRVVVCPALWRI